MKTILDQDVEELPPYSPVKVTLFVLLLGMIAFAGWRFLRASAAVAEVAEASKDYRKLFPARAAEVPAPPPAPAPVAAAAAPVSGMAMLKIDDNMRAPKPAPPAAEPPPPSAAPSESAPQAEAPPVAVAPVKAAALDSPKANRPAQKLFNQPRLNSGAFSGLNGGAGVSISGPGMGGGNTAPAAAPAMPVIPGLPAVPAPDKK